jgi:hypothetical protein
LIERPTLKTWGRGIGFVVILIGGLSFPVGIGINPERDTSRFHNLADLGLFVDYGFVLIVAGIALVALSILIPSRSRHDG